MDIHRHGDGVVFASSPLPLAQIQPSLPRLFKLSTNAWPERVFMRQRVAAGGPWRENRYGEALKRMRSIAQWLADDGALTGDVVTTLSGPSIEAAAPAVREAIIERLRHHNAAGGRGSRRVQRALLVSQPLSYDANALTDKGTANQNAARGGHRAPVRAESRSDRAGSLGECDSAGRG